MRAFRLAIALALGTVSFSSYAEIVTYAFSAHVSGMFVSDSAGLTSLNTSSLAGSPISMGDLLSGQVSYDTSISPISVAADGTGKTYNRAIKSMSLQSGTTGLQYQSTGVLDLTMVRIHSGGTNFGAVIMHTSDSSARTAVELDFTDFYGTALNSLAIPSDLSLAVFPYSLASYTWTSPDNSTRLDVTARLDTLTRVSAILEPSSWALFAAGAAVLAGVARRQRRV